jgi:hypothetical protein
LLVCCCCCCQKNNSIHVSPSLQRHGSKSNTNNALDQHPLNLLIDLLLLLFVGCVTCSASVIAVDAGCNVFISTPGIGIVTPVPNPRSVGFNDGSYVGVRDGIPRPVINAVLTVGLIVCGCRRQVTKINYTLRVGGCRCCCCEYISLGGDWLNSNDDNDNTKKEREQER